MSDIVMNAVDPTGKVYHLEKETMKLKEVISALCEYHGRCPVCFRFMDTSECTGCKNYYCDCECTPMTPQQILDLWNDTTDAGGSE